MANVARQASAKLSSSSAPSLAAVAQEMKGLAQAFQERVDREDAAVQAEQGTTDKHALPMRSFSLHIGAELRLPTHNRTATHRIDSPEQQAVQAQRDPFAGLPLQAWADRLGERVMPAFEAVKEEQRVSKLQAARHKHAPVDVKPPSIPHLLPFTRWAAQNAAFRDTFVIKTGKAPKPRLSWYHPDDTMVPRGWFNMGLMEDLRYWGFLPKAAAAAK